MQNDNVKTPFLFKHFLQSHFATFSYLYIKFFLFFILENCSCQVSVHPPHLSLQPGLTAPRQLLLVSTGSSSLSGITSTCSLTAGNAGVTAKRTSFNKKIDTIIAVASGQSL